MPSNSANQTNGDIMADDSALFSDGKTSFRPLSPMLMAHRGAMAEAPENTAAAFDKALFRRIDGIECDVQLSADGIPVVFHDDDLFRITGESGAIFDYPFEKLNTFDYGKWFSDSFSGASLMRLEDVLHNYAHRTNLMIELKTGRPETGDFHQRLRRLAQGVVGKIKTLVPKGRRVNIYVLSFDPDALEIAHEAAPDLKFMLNLETAAHFRADAANRGKIAYGYGVHFDELDKSFVQRVHHTGKTMMTYPCNTPGQVAKALDAGADFLLTDDPASVAPFFFKQCEAEAMDQ